MPGSAVIAAYERVLGLMREMHEAARAEQWERLVALEGSCRAVVEALMLQAPGEALSGGEAERKAAIIRQVLALDAAIRDMTNPWLRQLQALLGTREREKKLHAAYGGPDSG